MGTFPHKQFLGIEMKEREQDSGGWRISSVLNHGLRQKRVSFKRSIADSHTYANYWAPYHQTNSNMQKYPSGTIYKYHFLTHLGIADHCHVEHQGQGLPQCSQQRLAKRTCQRNPRQSGKSKTYITIPTKQP